MLSLSLIQLVRALTLSLALVCVSSTAGGAGVDSVQPANQEPKTSSTDSPKEIKEELPSKKPEPEPVLKGKVILLDPGHGGSDPGAMYYGVVEKDLVLSVSLSLRAKLVALGATVEMTRSNDLTLTLQQRIDQSNNICPDLFLSIHANAVANRAITGIETYWHDNDDQDLSDLFLKTLSGDLNETAKWSMQRNLFVLNGNRAPASLVEIGYLTNRASAARLNTSNYQDKVASSLSRALVIYLTDPATLKGCQPSI
ncbi:MAG: N-acetylmuramoyl-L-alanine amidase [Candidatus Obscuribacterales bacterium]|nr:N-acetylmuramoyl-L-alanine amidase [Candidatus Obscuribacterales bacterium]